MSPSSLWHQHDVATTIQELGSRREGLTEAEAQERLARFGPNRLTPPRKRGPLTRFLLQIHNVLIYVLLGADP